MATAIPTSSWSATVNLTAGLRYVCLVTPGAGGQIRMQWFDGTNWFDFSNNLITRANTFAVPVAATALRGQAFGVAGSFQETSVASAELGAAGSGGGGGGSDRTTVTNEADPVNGGQRVLSETLDGIVHTYGYDAQGRLITDTMTGGLVRNIDYSTGFGIASGNIYRDGGTIQTTVSQMPTLVTALLGLGVITAYPKFWVANFDGGRGLSVEWDSVGQGFRGVGGAPFTVLETYVDDPAGTYTGAGSGDRYTGTLPGWLGHLRANYRMECAVTCTGVTAIKSAVFYFGGNQAGSPGSAISSLFFSGGLKVQNRNSKSVQMVHTTGGFADSGAANFSSGGFTTLTVNTAADVVFSLRYGVINAADTARYNMVKLVRES